MKKKILNYIRCPICKKNLFNIIGRENENNVIENGNIVCQNCKNVFKISNGIIYLFETISNTALRDKESHEKEIKNNGNISNFQDDNWILNYPNVSKMGIDDRSERIGRLISENTELSIKRFITKKNSLILEIGAGKCWVISQLAKNNYCIGLDILTMKPIGLEAGEIYIKNKNVYFERISADMIKLPFLEQVFDYVIISSSLHHSPDIDKTLFEIRRVLKNNGQLILLNEPYKGIFGTRERLRVEDDFQSGLNEKRYTINDWKKYFITNNFKSQLFLPENLISIFQSKGWLSQKISVLLKIKTFLKIFILIFKPIILKVFDGYFNSLLTKNNEN